MKRANGIVLVASAIIILVILTFTIYVVLPADTKLIANALVEYTASLVEVPICYSRIANNLGVQTGDVRAYVIESLALGMTIDDVDVTLNQIAPTVLRETYEIESNHTTYVSFGIDLCSNPFGDMFLDTYFSKDEGLIRKEDAWDD